MKKTILVCCLLAALACSKEKQAENHSVITTATETAVLAAGTCGPIYADSIFYPSEYPADYEVRPLSGLRGTFGAYPDGLEIDEDNGNIEIKQSETGLKYLVWYVARGTRDTCKTFVTVSGVNYPDSIYSLKASSSFSTPVYNGTVQQPTVCTGNCEFDDGHDDDNGNGFADEPPAGQQLIPQGVAMDKGNGSINLKRTIQNGTIDTLGTFKDFVLNYRLSDRSAKALNKMTLRIYYYKSQGQIPAALKKDLEEKKKFTLLNSIKDPYKVSYTVKKSAGAALREREVKCRPPYIIVVQQ